MSEWIKLDLPSSRFGEGEPEQAGDGLMFTPDGNELALVFGDKAHLLQVGSVFDALIIIGAMVTIATGLTRTGEEFVWLHDTLRSFAPVMTLLPATTETLANA